MSKPHWNSAARVEVSWPVGGLRPGASGPDVRRLQEWLSLRGFDPGPVDGAYGRLTEAAVRAFQSQRDMADSGAADVETLAALSDPLAQAFFSPLPVARGESLPVAAWAAARRHLASSPREVGGPNGGPWVRSYMGGRQGAEYPWCAGFASTVVRQGAEAAAAPLPFRLSVGCDEIARAARAAGLLVPAAGARPPRGAAVFLVRGRREGDWTHTGLCMVRPDGSLLTVEGNTNERGGREGVAVRERERDPDGVDLALLARQ